MAEYDKNQKGVHLSYDKDNKKICAYYEDGIEHKDFFTPINEVFSGKIKEKNGKTYIRGFIGMSPIFNIIAALTIAGALIIYMYLRNPNIMILFVLLAIYFIYVKGHYRTNMQNIAYFLGECTQKKKKKYNPNKKQGKHARRQ